MKAEQLRARVLAEWRGLPQPAPRPDRIVTAGEVLRKVMDSLGLGDRLRAEEVLHAWGEIVGEFLAKHSLPERLKDGVLHVRVLQPTVAFELDRGCKREIVDKLKKRFGNRLVRDVKFRIG